MMTWENNPSYPSQYLAFRHIVDSVVSSSPIVEVDSSKDMLTELSYIVKNLPHVEKVGLFLSGGIDSGILAKLLPKGTHAFTINFDAESDVDEATKAKKYVRENELIHHVIKVSWKHYEIYEPALMKNRNAPLHPLEVALYKAALAAKTEGLNTILTGTGADSNFGGMDKLLSRDWTFDEFVERYTFIDPVSVLKNPYDIRGTYMPYQTEDKIDCAKFLREIHCVEQQHVFRNAINSANLFFFAPFTEIKLKNSLDIKKIRSGKPKYLVFDVFKKLYPNISPPKKIAFIRPMEEWFADGLELKSDIFLEDLDVNKFSGEQKYLLHCLDRFMELQ